MVEKAETLPRKEPTQERSAALVDALLEATAHILAEEGAESLTTNHIAEVAGTSVGSLYQYFPNKESLLAAVIERELEEDMSLIREVLYAYEDLPLSELVGILCEEIIASTRSRRQLHQEMLPLVDELHRTQLVENERDQISTVFHNILMDHFDELPLRLSEGEDAMEKIRCASFVAMNAIEMSLNAIKVQEPELLERPELADLISRIFDAVMMQE